MSEIVLLAALTFGLALLGGVGYFRGSFIVVLLSGFGLVAVLFRLIRDLSHVVLPVPHIVVGGLIGLLVGAGLWAGIEIGVRR